jgi:hypothetical protein
LAFSSLRVAKNRSSLMGAFILSLELKSRFSRDGYCRLG